MHDLTQLTPEIDALPIPTMPTPYDLTTTDYHCALASSLPAHDTTWGCPSGAPC
jgi:hypothetical protein